MFIIDLADEYFLNKEEIKDPDLLYENSLIFYLLLEDVRNVKDVLVSEKTLLNFTRTRNEDRELKELTKGMLTSLINKNFPFKLLS